MCRCFFSHCPGVEIPGHAPIRCQDQVYVFIREPCENPASINCIPMWRPDPRGNHDQCSNCTRTQRYNFPAGVRTSPSKRKVHTPRHAARNYAPPPYVRPPCYEDPSSVPESTAATELEFPLTPSRFNLSVVPPMPTRPPPSGNVGQTLRIPTANTATRPAEPRLAWAGFPTPAPETNSERTGLRIPTANAAARPAGTRLAAAGLLTPPPETNSRRTGLRIQTGNTATRQAEPGLSQSASLGRMGPWTTTRYDTVRPPTPSPSRSLTSTATALQIPAASYLPQPPTRRLSARPGSTDRMVSTAAAVEAPTGQQDRFISPPLPRALPVVYTGGADTRTHPLTVNSQPAPRPPTRGISAQIGSTERMASRAATAEAPTGQQSRLTSPPLPRVLPAIHAGEPDRTDPSTANSQLAPENLLTLPARPDVPRSGTMFLAPPPRHDTRSPPLGVNLAEWDVEEAAPQVNNNSNDWDLYEPRYLAHGNRGNDIFARPGLGNGGVVDQSSIAQTGRSSANDRGSSKENQHSLRWRSIREWARRTEEIAHRGKERGYEQQRQSASRQGRSSRSGGQANQQDPTQQRQSIAESLRALRRRLFTWPRQYSQPESASHQAQDGFESSQNPDYIPLAPNNPPAGGRQSTPMSDRTVSDVLRRTRHEVPELGQQRSHAGSESESITTPSILNTGTEWSQDRGYNSGSHPSQSSRSNRSSSSDDFSIEGLDGGAELLEIGSAIVRVDAGAQATDWDWNF